MTDVMIGSNLLFEVILEDEFKTDREAVSFHMFEKHIPENRVTPIV